MQEECNTTQIVLIGRQVNFYETIGGLRTKISVKGRVRKGQRKQPRGGTREIYNHDGTQSRIGRTQGYTTSEVPVRVNTEVGGRDTTVDYLDI